MNLFLAAAQRASDSGFDMNSGISVAVLVIIIGAVWRLSAILSDIKGDLKKLRGVPARLRHIENHLLSSEEDLNNLWAFARAGEDGQKLLSMTRRARFTPLEEDE